MTALFIGSAIAGVAQFATGSAPAPASPLEFRNGDWPVTGIESHSNKVIVLTGNLTVASGGTLELTNVTLIMNSTSAAGQYGITVADGGRLYLNDTDDDPDTASDRTIVTWNATHGLGFAFQVNATGTFGMRNSRIDHCALAATDPAFNNSGPRFLTDDAVIEGSEFVSCANGIIVDSANPSIGNVTVSGSLVNGILLTNESNPSHRFDIRLEGCAVTSSAGAGLYMECDNANLTAVNCSFISSGKGGMRLDAGHTLNATVLNTTVRLGAEKGGICMFGLPGVCVIRAEVHGCNISDNLGVSSLLLGVRYSEMPARAVFANATGNEIWVPGAGADANGDGMLLVFATDLVVANIRDNKVLGPNLQNGVNVGKVSHEFNPYPATKTVSTNITGNEIVNIQGGALKATASEDLYANVTGNHIYHPFGRMGCGSVSLGWYAAKVAGTTPANATVVVRDNRFEGIADSGGMGIKAIYNLYATVEGNVLGKISNVGVNEWGFKLGWVDDDDSKLQPSPDGYPARNVRAVIRNNTIDSASGPGIIVYSGNGTTIHDNTINGRGDGILVRATTGNTLVFNNKVGNGTGTGIKMYQSTGVSVFGNKLNSNFYGLGVESKSKDNMFFDNVITKPYFKYGFYIGTDSFSHTFPANNTVNGEWFRYYHNLWGTPATHATVQGHDIQEPLMSNLGQLVLVNSTYVDVADNIVANGSNGIVLLRTNNTLVEGNTISLNEDFYNPAIGSGIRLTDSHNNSIMDNDLLDNVYAVKLEASSVDNTIWSNTISKASDRTAIHFDTSGSALRNAVADNNSADGSPIHYHYRETGVLAEDVTAEEPLLTNIGQFVIIESGDVHLSNITVLNGGKGLYVSGSDNVTVDGSNISQNGCNICIQSSTNITLEKVSAWNGTNSVLLTASSPMIRNSTIGQAGGLALNLTGAGSHPVLLNSSYNRTQVNISAGSDMTVRWFLDVHVSTNNASCEGANVTVLDSAASVAYDLVTGADGSFTGLVLDEFFQNNTSTQNLSAHSISIRKTGFDTFGLNFTANRSQAIFANLTDILPPELAALTLEPQVQGTSSSIVWLNATLNDGATGGSLITDAEWYVSELQPTVLPGAGFEALAADGSFDEVSEGIAAEVNIDNWLAGDYTIWVRGCDAWGNWCGWASADFEVIDNEGPLSPTGPVIAQAVFGTSEDELTVVTVMDDSTTGNSRIFGVEWEVILGADQVINSSSPIAATVVVDGSYNEANETVEVSIDIRFWEIGNYTFRIRGYDEYDNFGAWYTTPFLLVDDVAPSSPSNLQAFASDTGIVLTWTPNTESDLAGYRIYRSASSGGGYALSATVGPEAVSWTDANVSSGETMYYVISAFDDADPPNESPFSSEATATYSGEVESPSGGSWWMVLVAVIVVLAVVLLLVFMRKRGPLETPEAPLEKESSAGDKEDSAREPHTGQE